MKKTLILGIVSGVVGAILAIAINGYFNGIPASAKSNSNVTGATTQQQNAVGTSEPYSRPESREAPANSYTDDELVNISVYDKTNMGVVNIRTEIEVRRGFFVERGVGAGSGWVLDKEGHIVTNFHVIQDSDSIEVTLYDGSSDQARVVGADPANDIALLKITAPSESLHPLELGDSDFLKVGQKAIAIGNPFGFERSMSVGIISSINRSLKARDGRMIKSIIQVDAALNQGNSGGPLLDSSGRLIGMNTAIKSAGSEQNAQNSGVGFAVPINTIRRVIPQLKTHGRVIRASIGVTQAAPTRQGLLLIEVVPNGPAGEAGLKGVIQVNQYRYGDTTVSVREQRWNEADIILAVNGRDIQTFDELLTEVEKVKPGENVELEILRDRQRDRVVIRTVEER